MKYVLGRAFTSITKKVLFSDKYTFFCPRLFLKTDQYHTKEATVWFTCCVSFFPGQEVVGDKITLGVFSNETDWSQEKIAMKVRH